MIRWLWIAALAAGSVGAMAIAQEDAPPAGMTPEAMGLTGPPQEIQDMAFLVGTWDVATEVRMGPATPWMTMTGTATYAYAAGGAAMEMDFQGEMMGMPLIGVSHTVFNRQTGKWSQTWIDNMGAYMSVYTGTMADGRMVLEGEDYMMGQTWLTRTTMSDITDTSYTWQMEHSTDDGATWYVSMKSGYSKQVE